MDLSHFAHVRSYRLFRLTCYLRGAGGQIGCLAHVRLWLSIPKVFAAFS